MSQKLLTCVPPSYLLPRGTSAVLPGCSPAAVFSQTHPTVTQCFIRTALPTPLCWTSCFAAAALPGLHWKDLRKLVSFKRKPRLLAWHHALRRFPSKELHSESMFSTCAGLSMQAGPLPPGMKWNLGWVPLPSATSSVGMRALQKSHSLLSATW